MFATRESRFPRRACVALGSLVCFAACGEEQPPINRVGVNVVEKSQFEGSWYMARTVVDVDYEGAALGTFPGDAASDAALSFTALPRVYFDIQEDYLIAYRDYELVPGADGELPGRAEQDAPELPDGIDGEPVAAFKIESHFDIRRAYNPSTGEERNVIEENDTDRRWYEREFMRVDWSKNLLPGFYGQTYNLNELLGAWKREPADLFVQDASVFPDSWRPKFDRMSCEAEDDDGDACSASDRDLADDYDKDELYHFSFVNQEVLSPGTATASDGTPFNRCTGISFSSSVPGCSSLVSYVRTSFLKVSDKREYVPENWVDTRFDRFGYFRLSHLTYDRSTGTPDDPAFFATDFLNYNVNRHNIWKRWLDDDGEPLAYDEREVRPIRWYTTPELPAHLVQPSFDVVGEWNESLMETVRLLRNEPLPRYPDVDCQTEDPDGYCFCQEDPDTGEIIRPSCPGRYDPFLPPDGYEGEVSRPYDCWVDVPEGAEPDLSDPALSDSDFNGWYDAHFVGDECVNVLRINTCNRASIADNDGTVEGLECQERGDLRYKFLSYVDQPGTGFLGIATLRGDPITGEIIAGDANIGGPALDSYRTTALQTYDLINGTLDDSELIAGANTRDYFENIGKIEQPARPRTDFSVASRTGAPVSDATRREIDNRMEQAMRRIGQLQGPEGRANIFTDRGQNLVGSELERRLTAGLEGLVAAGFDQLPGDSAGQDLSEAMLDQVSPFRVDIYQQLEQVRDQETRLSQANVMMPNEYVDDSVQWFVNNHADWPRARLQFTINRLLYRQTELHEMGHCLGLRHHFGGSADSEHYYPEYAEIVERYPLPDPDDYDDDGDGTLGAEEEVDFQRAYEQVREKRELAGIDGTMNSSVMDYTANWYERIQPLASYDRAAIGFGYGDLVEAYAGQPSLTTARKRFRGYTGGEVCERDSDCPYAADGDRAHLLLDENREAGLTQHCVTSPRNESVSLCSNFDDDIAEAADEGGDLQPLTYRFCTDERADSTLAWCNRFDEGDSYREIVRNIADDYERMYLFSAFRRYRKNFSIISYRESLLGRRLSVLQTIYQNLIFRYTSDPAFREELGPFGYYDQFLATTDILNFYARIMAQPNVGGYVYDNRTDTYVRGFYEPDAEDAELAVPLGIGRYFSSDYQAGLSGIERIERVGSFFDKLWVIQLLTIRGWEADYTRDLAFYTNFYDLFPNEMQQLWNGLIREFPKAYMPRVVCDDGEDPANCDDPHLLYMDFYRGDCSEGGTCRPNPAEVTYAGYPVLNGGGSLSLQIYAANYGLLNFPVYFDSSFQNQLFICVEGQGDCYQPDQSAVEGVDFVRYTSDRYRKSFLAFQVEPRIGVGEQTSIGFEMVQEARDLNAVLNVLLRFRSTEPAYDVDQVSQEDLDQLAAIDYELPTSPPDVERELARIDRRLVNLESFFNQMIELERQLGIQDFRYFR